MGSGADAPATEITDLAKADVGTLYPYFPRRSDLIVAGLQHAIDECIGAAEQLRTDVHAASRSARGLILTGSRQP